LSTLEAESEVLFSTWFSDLAQVALALAEHRETRHVTVDK